MFLTVFTPAYNRVHTLIRTYESLREQTCKDFIWIIVDDGSTDNTGSLVAKWQAALDNGFDIQYIYKENGGLHTAYNAAIEVLNSELAVCIDSDDFMPPDAVAAIKEKWEADGAQQYGGIIGLDFSLDHKLIGGWLPQKKAINLIDLSIGKEKIAKGDKKIVVRSELYKAVAPMRVFPGEKNFNPHYMHLEISREYDFLVLNKELCTVEYQPGGMTASIFKQYLNSPNSFLEIRKQTLSFPGVPIKLKLRTMIHLVSSAIFAKRLKSELQSTNYPILFFLCLGPGLLLSLLIRIKGKA